MPASALTNVHLPEILEESQNGQVHALPGVLAIPAGAESGARPEPKVGHGRCMAWCEQYPGHYHPLQTCYPCPQLPPPPSPAATPPVRCLISGTTTRSIHSGQHAFTLSSQGNDFQQLHLATLESLPLARLRLGFQLNPPHPGPRSPHHSTGAHSGVP